MGENDEAAAAIQEIQVAGPAVQAIRVVTETRNLRTQPFAIPDEMNAMGKAWQEWLEGIEREFRFFKISEAVDKKDAIIIGVRAGGARGAAAPPNFGQLRFFGQQEKIWAKPTFKDVSCFFMSILER